jgi:hypothetical protein
MKRFRQCVLTGLLTMEDGILKQRKSKQFKAYVAIRPTTESGLTLSLSKLLRDVLFRPGSACYSSLIWTNTTTASVPAR